MIQMLTLLSRKLESHITNDKIVILENIPVQNIVAIF